MSERDMRDGSTSTPGSDRAARDRGDDSSGPDLPAFALHDVRAGAAARIRNLALASLRRRERLAAHSGLAKAWSWYERAVEPTLWLGLGLGYCAWAVAGAFAVLH
jgi:hypothetical protein